MKMMMTSPIFQIAWSKMSLEILNITEDFLFNWLDIKYSIDD